MVRHPLALSFPHYPIAHYRAPGDIGASDRGMPLFGLIFWGAWNSNSLTSALAWTTLNWEKHTHLKNTRMFTLTLYPRYSSEYKGVLHSWNGIYR